MPEIRPSPRRPDPEKDKKHQEESRRQARFSISYLLVSLFFLWLFQVLVLTPLVNRKTEIAYSDFKKKLANSQIVEVTIGDRSIEGVMKNPKADGSPATIPFNSVFVSAGDPKLIEDLQ
ncbi:MAG: ATP-dependent metallopeptidase FtsH/Yme1/Tma family protein, partial [Candidatus Sulfotelmatobacter sp.]